ncbi:DUF2155 domain-containing protein [Frigidibacter oleivorans]|uniref:DUF2155 domain-containing protein n=1 Tax=Frigidibacter oleivorans TaxID=2487129 RepID=UPI001F29CF65|nr:DUF2155 domain-containing protein [Frigidibacter oleivorans]
MRAALLALLAGLALAAPARAQEQLPDGVVLPLEGLGAEEDLPPVPVTPEALEPESSIDSESAGAVASGSGAMLRGLDRLSGETVDLEIGAGATAALFRLSVSLSDCRFPVSDPSSDAYAHLTVRDRDEVVFDGWMVASSPALVALDHPRYDLWVLHCVR